MTTGMDRTGMDEDGRRGNPWRIAVWGTAACLLLLPLVAMQFTGEVKWTGTDFLVMGVLLAAACIGYEVGTRLSSSTIYRAAFGLAVLGGFLLVWINLAVGVIHGENEPANLLYAAVLAIGIGGTWVVRGQAPGMARVLVAMAATTALIGMLAMTLLDAGPETAGVTGLFVALWLASAWLFRRSGQSRSL